jgi:hypothetical protein
MSWFVCYAIFLMLPVALAYVRQFVVYVLKSQSESIIQNKMDGSLYEALDYLEFIDGLDRIAFCE